VERAITLPISKPFADDRRILLFHTHNTSVADFIQVAKNAPSTTRVKIAHNLMNIDVPQICRWKSSFSSGVLEEGWRWEKHYTDVKNVAYTGWPS